MLGISPKASVEEIERAYRTLARQVHPDRNAGDSERAEARMKQLNQIRETLTDPLLRAAYDDQLRREQGPLRPPEPPRPQPAESPAPPRHQPPPRYQPHPHVVPFLRTEAEWMAARPHRPPRGPIVAMVVVLALTGTAIVMLWPRPEPLVQRPIAEAPPPRQPPPSRPAVTIVRGDTAATRRAIRKTAKVVPLGFTFDEVVEKFGPPDRVESHPAPGDVTLIYGEVRVELRDGKVVGGAP